MQSPFVIGQRNKKPRKQSYPTRRQYW